MISNETINNIMKDSGFTDYREGYWYFCRIIYGDDISFNLTIPKTGYNGWNYEMEVLDENFLQPYDYEYYLRRGSTNMCAKKVSEEVEKWLRYFENLGIIYYPMKLEYKGFTTTVWYSGGTDNCFYGKIDNIDDLVTFEDEVIENAEKEFHDAVDDYLAFCNEEGKDPYAEEPPKETPPKKRHRKYYRGKRIND